MVKEPFSEMLKGGHANSLGRTIEVVDIILADHARFQELFECYFSDDETVRLRTSNAMKRVEAEAHDLLVPYIDRFLNEISNIDQPSTQWTLAQLFLRLEEEISANQKKQALTIMKHNLASHDDWIVLNATMETLAQWSKDDNALKRWLKPHLQRLSEDTRKSVAARARKKIAALY